MRRMKSISTVPCALQSCNISSNASRQRLYYLIFFMPTKTFYRKPSLWLWHPCCLGDQSFTAQNWHNFTDPEQCVNCRIMALKTENLGCAHRACQYIRFSNLLSIWQSKHRIRGIPEERKSCVCSQFRLVRIIRYPPWHCSNLSRKAEQCQ